jgi:hypothetical protein
MKVIKRTHCLMVEKIILFILPILTCNICFIDPWNNDDSKMYFDQNAYDWSDWE